MYCLGFGLMLAGGAVQAQELKLGFVDTARVLKDAPQADLARRKLEHEFAPRDEKIVSMQKRLKSLDDRQNKDIAIMSDSERRKLERDMIELRRDIKRAKEEFTEDFNLRRNEELTKLQKLIIQTTVAVAKEDGYDIVLSDSVLYSSKRVDITDKILEKLRTSKDVMQPKNNNAAN
ncbi:MAG: OmpH family outer membrane protein [Gammaproteobacteria bacterium]|nr:OmpH family outer membrane protein [Gammaproteobacteria bacterium]